VKSGRQCVEEKKVEDPEALAETLDDLVARWDALNMMSNTKQERLENALTLAEEFESGVKEELKILKGVDTRLRSFGPVADNLDGVNKQIEEMEVKLNKLYRTVSVLYNSSWNSDNKSYPFLVWCLRLHYGENKRY
jgi:archaellum component FlaC